MAQEISLARNVLILLGKDTFKFPDLIDAMNNFQDPDLLSGFSDCTFARFANIISHPDKLRSRTLINLVDDFRDKECQVPRDRIYALLPLCCDFQHPEVDYNQSSEDLAFDVLKRSNEALCTCSALLVAQTLCLANHDELEEASGQMRSFIEFDVRGLRFARHALLCNDQIHSWGHYKLIGTDMFGHDQLFSDLCPAFDTLMDALQSHAIETSRSTSMEEDASRSLGSESRPSLLRMMDEEHVQALRVSFNLSLNIAAHDMDPNISTVRIALWLLAELIPQSIPICPRIAHRKEKLRDSEETISMYDQDGSAYRSLSTERRGTETYWSHSMDVRRIDSVGPGKSQEDERPISQLRLVKRAIQTPT